MTAPPSGAPGARDGNVNSAETLRKLQMTELEILKVIKDFCEEHHIEWFVDGGTALGARRHEGFIPWDDDVDVAMVGEEFDRFLRLAEEGLPEGYSLHTSRNTPGYAAFFAKVYKDGTRFVTAETEEAGCPQGIYVDVFAYDRLPADPRERERRIRLARRLQHLSYLYHAKTIQVPGRGLLGSLQRLGCRVAHVFVHALMSPRSLERKFAEEVRSGISDPSDDCLNLCWTNAGPFPLDVLLPVSTLTFEGVEVPVPRDCDRYLEILYGDWRALPSPEERHTHFPKLLDFGDGVVWTQQGAGSALS